MDDYNKEDDDNDKGDVGDVNDDDDNNNDGGSSSLPKHSHLTSTSATMIIPRSQQADAWSHLCLPRLWAVLGMGCRHAILHDLQWMTRAEQNANLL